MADSKQVPLSIVLRTVDKATAGIQAFNKRLDAMTRPVRELNKAFKDLGEKSGFNRVGDAFRGVGSAVEATLGRLLMVGGVVAAAALGIKALVDEFATLGHVAERAGVEVDFLAGMRYAAGKAGVSVEQLDQGLITLTQNIGQAKAGTGRMLKFLNAVSPALARQVTAAHTTEEALGLLADAMAKLPDASRRAALAQKTLGDSALAPVLMKGSKGIQELMAKYAQLAGTQDDAAKGALGVEDSFRDLTAATDGVKAALVTGLAPALNKIIDDMTTWLQGHREDIARWADDVGKRLPAAVDSVVRSISGAVDHVGAFVEGIGGWKAAAVGVAAVIAGPLVASVGALSLALVATPFGQVLLGLSAITLAVMKLTGATEGFEEVAERLGFTPKKKTPEQEFQSDMDAMMESGRRAAASDAAARKALDNDPVVDKSRMLQEQSDAMLAIPTDSIRERSHRARMDALNAQINQFAAQHAGPAAPAPAGGGTITVNFNNAPPGMRVSADPRAAALIDTTVGYQMGSL